LCFSLGLVLAHSSPTSASYMVGITDVSYHTRQEFLKGTYYIGMLD
jgi:hypothetical protein